MPKYFSINKYLPNEDQEWEPYQFCLPSTRDLTRALRKRDRNRILIQKARKSTQAVKKAREALRKAQIAETEAGRRAYLASSCKECKVFFDKHGPYYTERFCVACNKRINILT